jgi:hypothetical protein
MDQFDRHQRMFAAEEGLRQENARAKAERETPGALGHSDLADVRRRLLFLVVATLVFLVIVVLAERSASEPRLRPAGSSMGSPTVAVTRVQPPPWLATPIRPVNEDRP